MKTNSNNWTTIIRTEQPFYKVTQFRRPEDTKKQAELFLKISELEKANPPDEEAYHNAIAEYNDITLDIECRYLASIRERGKDAPGMIKELCNDIWEYLDKNRNVIRVEFNERRKARAHAIEEAHNMFLVSELDKDKLAKIEKEYLKVKAENEDNFDNFLAYIVSDAWIQFTAFKEFGIDSTEAYRIAGNFAGKFYEIPDDWKRLFKEEKDDISKYIPGNPAYYTRTTTALTNVAFSGKMGPPALVKEDEQPHYINQQLAPGTEEYQYVYASAIMDDPNVKVIGEFTRFDEKVLNGIMSQCFSHYKETGIMRCFITVAQIWQAITRNPKAKPNKAQINDIEDSINRMRHSKINVYTTFDKEFITKFITDDPPQTLQISGAFLTSAEIEYQEVTYKTGKKQKFYVFDLKLDTSGKLVFPSFFYNYAFKLKQFETVKADAVAPLELNTTNSTLVIQSLITDRIRIVKSNSKRYENAGAIDFNVIYDLLEVEKRYKDKYKGRNKALKKVETVLEAMEKSGDLKGITYKMDRKNKRLILKNPKKTETDPAPKKKKTPKDDPGT